MYPRKVPPGFSSAERDVHTMLAESIGADDWTFFHSVPVAVHPTQSMGEIDFLAITKDVILVIEVKGGRISCDHGVWFSNMTQLRSSPLEQASANMHALASYLKNTGLPRVVMGSVAVLPHSDFSAPSVSWLQEAMIDRAAIKSFGLITMLEIARQAYLQNEKRLGRVTPVLSNFELAQLCGAIRPDVVTVLRLDEALRRNAETVIELEKDQLDVLETIVENPRALVEGIAGSGKTVLAYQAALRLLADNPSWKAAYICKSEELAADIRAMASRGVASNRLTVESGASLLGHYLMNVLGMDLSDSGGGVIKTNFPSVEEEDNLGSSAKFDFVVVDEGQDVRGSLMTTRILSAVLKGGVGKGRIAWFQDMDQAIAPILTPKLTSDYLDDPEFEPSAANGFAIIKLPKVNYRNPAALAKSALAAVGLKARYLFEGELTQPLELQESENQAQTLYALLCSLSREGVSPDDVHVISLASEVNLSFDEIFAQDYEILPNRKLPVSYTTGDLPFRVTFTNLLGAKGREFPVVIIVDLPDFSADYHRNMLYVAVTRATSRAILIGSPMQIRAIKLIVGLA